MSLFLKNISEHNDIIAKLHELNQVVLNVGELLADTLRNGGKILLCGNGGSAADSQHFAAELIGRFAKDRRPLAAIALSTDSSAVTCIGNDYSFTEIFARQVAALAQSDDLLIAISTSGQSGNLIRAVEEAQKLGVATVGLLGRDGGRLREMCSRSIVVPSYVTARIQECHILIAHTLCELIEEQLGLL
jgi:D-sedoheptulose 7-phosphate isomerase